MKLKLPVRATEVEGEGEGKKSKRKGLRSSASKRDKSDILPKKCLKVPKKKLAATSTQEIIVQNEPIAFAPVLESKVVKQKFGNPLVEAYQLKEQKIKEVGQKAKEYVEKAGLTRELGPDGLPLVYLFDTQCTGGTLCKLIKEFTPMQRKAVDEIGFGGLLSLQLARKNTSMMYWCVKCFDGSSSVFKISESKEFEISEFDVYDMFMLPLNPGIDVEGVSRGPNVKNPDFELKLSWRQFFGYLNH